MVLGVFKKVLGGDENARELRKLSPEVAEVNEWE